MILVLKRDSKPHTSKPTEGNGRQHAKQSPLTWFIPLILIGLLVGLYFVIPGFKSFVNEAYSILISGDEQRVQSWVEGFGFWGPIVIMLAMLIQSLLAFIPSVLIMIVAVLAYGPWWGGLLAWGGLLIAALMAYGIGRALGPVTVERLIGAKTEKKVAGFIERYGVWAIIIERISPVLSSDAMSYAAGLLKMGVWRFMLATAVGMLPLTILIAFLGESIDRLMTGLIWVSVISLLVFVAYVIYDRRKHGQEDD